MTTEIILGNESRERGESLQELRDCMVDLKKTALALWGGVTSPIIDSELQNGLCWILKSLEMAEECLDHLSKLALSELFHQESYFNYFLEQLEQAMNNILLLINSIEGREGERVKKVTLKDLYHRLVELRKASLDFFADFRESETSV